MTSFPRKIKTVIITGPTGAIGIALCQLLVREGVNVYAVCRPDSPRQRALPVSSHLHLTSCDMADYGSLPNRIGTPADAFFHLAWAGTTGEGRNDMLLQTGNIRSTIAAVHAASELGCQVFLGAGSQAEYGRVEGALKPDTPCNPETGYGMAKFCAGRMSRAECQRSGTAHIWVRILSVYGPGDGGGSMIMSTIRSLLAKQKPSLTAGAQMWDYLYVSDAAEALYRAALYGHDGAVYPLGSGTAMPLRSYVEILRDVIDPSLPLGFGEVPYSPTQVMYLQADISELTAHTGFLPKVDFPTGIRTTIQGLSISSRQKKYGRLPSAIRLEEDSSITMEKQHE